MFRKRRFRLRHLVASFLAVGAAYAIMPDREAPVSAQPAFVMAAAPVVAPAPNAVAPHADYEVLNLKDAFDVKPAAPGYAFDDTPGMEEPVIEPAAAVAASAAEEPAQAIVRAPRPAPKPLMRQISLIQESITKVLQEEPAAASDGGDDGSDAESQKKVRVGKGDTLMELLVRNNVPRDEAYEAIQALRKVYDPRDLNPGQNLTVFFHRDPAIADPKFVGLRIEPDMINALIVNRADDGSFRAGKQAKAVHREMRAFRGRIGNSLYIDAKGAGVPDSVILELIRMYSWGVDFQRDIQRGDGFEVMFEQYVTDDGVTVPGKGNVAYAQLTLSGRGLPLYRFEDANGDSDYFDPSGQSAKKPLMKTPIDGARISSGFGVRRHPVLGYNKMHKGMDFAAPRGTPIYAAGDGTVEKAGRFSSYGNYIRIRHRAGLATAYAHLNGFKAGVKGGARVKQGQVIGYVGTTGRSTGPHLHYEILLNGRQVNPKTVKLSGGRALAGKELKAFKASVARADSAFAGTLPQASAAVASSR